MEIRVLIPYLRSKSLLERKRASRQLATRGIEAVQFLVPLLRDEYDYVQIAAAETLGLIGESHAVPALKDMLQGKTYGLTRGEGSPGQFGSIVEAAAKALGQIGTYDSIALLLDVFRNYKDQFTRAAAALGLGYVRDHSVVDELLTALNSNGYHYIQYCIVQSLERINEPRSAPALRKLLHRPAWMIQLLIVHALGTMRDMESEFDLQEIFEGRQQFLEAISGSREFVMQEEIHFRASAARSLGLIGTPEGLNTLQSGFSSNEVGIQRCAAIGLGFSRPPHVYDELIVDALMAMLKKELGQKESHKANYDALAAEALVYMDVPSAKPVLRLLIENVLQNPHGYGWGSTYKHIEDALTQLAIAG